MKAVLALIGAIAMVAVAVVVRNTFIEGDSSSPSTPITVVCAQEFSLQCGAIKNATTRIEPAGVTADALTTSANPAFEVWVVPSPWPELVDSVRTAAGLDPLFPSAATPIASSPLALVVRAERASVVAATCKVAVTAIDWRCLGDQAGATWSSIGGSPTWGDVKPGIDTPPTSGIGLLVAAQALTSKVGRTDYGREVFEDSAVRDWFTRLARSVPPSTIDSTPLERMLAVPASYDAVGDADAAITTQVQRADATRKAQFTPVPPSGGATAVVVVAGLPGRSSARARVSDALRNDPGRRLFKQSGWTVVTSDRPLATGLPDGGTMQVIRQQWVEALR